MLYHGLVRVVGVFAPPQPLQSQPGEPGGVEARGALLAFVFLAFVLLAFMTLAYEEYTCLCR